MIRHSIKNLEVKSIARYMINNFSEDYRRNIVNGLVYDGRTYHTDLSVLKYFNNNLGTLKLIRSPWEFKFMYVKAFCEKPDFFISHLSRNFLTCFPLEKLKNIHTKLKKIPDKRKYLESSKDPEKLTCNYLILDKIALDIGGVPDNQEIDTYYNYNILPTVNMLTIYEKHYVTINKKY